MEELRFARVPSLFGSVSVVESRRGVLLVELGPVTIRELRERARALLGGEVELSEDPGLDSARQLTDYFAGTLRRFRCKLDLSHLPSFQRDVLTALARVRFGQLTSYGELAARVGRPGAARAVGRAMAKNPIPVIVPCHRVVAADGSLGGFSGGLERKRKLHALEGIEPLAGGWSCAAAPGAI